MYQIIRLHTVIQDAAEMGNDPFFALKKRVVSKDQGTVCIKCFQQVLDRQVRPMSRSDSQALEDEEYVSELREKFFAKDMFNLLSPAEKTKTELQFNTYMDQRRPGSSMSQVSRLGTAASIRPGMRKVAPGQLVHHGMGRVTPAKQWPMPSFRMQKSKSLSPPRKSLWSTAGLNANGKTSPPRRGRYSNKAYKQERISDFSSRSPRINQAMGASWRPPRW